jgi:hypothetical protein
VVNQLHKSGGLTVVVACILGDPLDIEALKHLPTHKERLYQMSKGLKMKVFPRAFVARNLSECLANNIQSTGLGHLKPNTVFFELPHMEEEGDKADVLEFANMVKIVSELN